MTGKIYYISDKKQFKNLNEPIFSMCLTLLKNKHIRMKHAHKHQGNVQNIQPLLQQALINQNEQPCILSWYGYASAY